MSSRQSRIEEIAKRIEETFGRPDADPPGDFHGVFEELMAGLEAGTIRAAEPSGRGWKVNSWVKKGILMGFRFGNMADYSVDEQFRFFDKETYPLRRLTLQDRVRVVPGGTSIRRGCFVGPGVVIMPPAYLNVGSHVGSGSMIDSHALVGSCAQVGARVHVSAAAQIGGVLEPVGALPVIIEDEVLIGGNCGVYEGTVVRRRAVIGAGVILTGSTPVYDLENDSVLRKSPSGPLTIPENAVVVPGSRTVGRTAFARQNGLQLYCPVIVKYRDEKTDAASALEEALR